MAYTIMTPQLGAPKIATVHTADYVAAWQLGDIVRAVDPTNGVGEFIYLKGLDATAIGTWVTYNQDDNTTTLLAANAIGPVAIAMSASVTGKYGWYQISGKASGLALASFADNGNVYATATAGSVDDAVVAGDRVKNAKGASTIVGAGLADFEINRPWMDDALAA